MIGSFLLLAKIRSMEFEAYALRSNISNYSKKKKGNEGLKQFMF